MDNFVFLGNDNISKLFLEKIIVKKKPLFIITGEDRLARRGRKPTESPLIEIAKKFSIKVLKTENPNEEEFLENIKKNGKIDFFLVFSFGFILKKEFLSIPQRMSVNIHPSFLPYYRGPAPINRTIINGEKKSGITFFKMDESIDGGDIIYQESFELSPYIDSIELKNIMVQKAVNIFLEFNWSENFKIYKQDERFATYAKKIRKKELFLDLSLDNKRLANKINGLAEYGLKCRIGKYNVKIRKAIPHKNMVKNGIVEINDLKELIIGCENGSISVLKIQPEGRNIMDIKSFINGYRVKNGEKVCVESLE